tara:strand:+ start:130 stop:396 length:267 start_codon:yes stop_codon:yes gene_type:complete
MINFNELPNDIKDHIFKMNREYHSKINKEYENNKIKYDRVISDLMLVHMWAIRPCDMIDYIEDVRWENDEGDEDDEDDDTIYFFLNIH